MPERFLDVLKLAEKLNLYSKSGALPMQLLNRGHTLYAPDSNEGNKLKRYLPSGRVETGFFSDGKFVAMEVIVTE